MLVLNSVRVVWLYYTVRLRTSRPRLYDGSATTVVLSIATVATRTTTKQAGVYEPTAVVTPTIREPILTMLDYRVVREIVVGFATD